MHASVVDDALGIAADVELRSDEVGSLSLCEIDGDTLTINGKTPTTVETPTGSFFYTVTFESAPDDYEFRYERPKRNDTIVASVTVPRSRVPSTSSSNGSPAAKARLHSPSVTSSATSVSSHSRRNHRSPTKAASCFRPALSPRATTHRSKVHAKSTSSSRASAWATIPGHSPREAR